MGFKEWFSRKTRLEKHLTPDQQAQVVGAIRAAEGKTSGEIRIHLELLCPGDPVERAAAMFAQLGMSNTELRNGVLIYCALQDRRFALYGDAGIHERVGQAYWQELVEHVEKEIREHSLAAGLALAAESIGESLSQHFPRAADDRDELSDDISFKSN